MVGKAGMSLAPDVSIVMSAYNAAPTLSETLESVLGQQACTFEFIVIDDGSCDASARILDEYAARDPRLRVVHQENTGLTRALMRGCELAQGEFIARQDAGDISLPGRLASQLAFLRAQPHAVMAACGVRFCGPENEPLYELVHPMQELDSGLRSATLDQLRGPPHHGATMFRREAYLRAGGYRAAFVVAQDLDLWLRLAELGACLGMEQVGYAARLELGSISSRRREEQFRLARLALQCRALRQTGGDEPALLASIEIKPSPRRPISKHERARFHYFVGSCLRRNDPQSAKAYFGMALRDNPLHLKALAHWMIG